MAFSLLPSSFKTPAISLTLLSFLLFFLLKPSPSHPSTSPLIPRRSLLNTTTTTIPLPCSSIDQTPPRHRCSFSLLHCSGDSNGLINYFSLHFCLFRENPFVSVPFLSLILLLQFYVLVKAAQDQFSVVVTKISTHLNLSPSMGAVTLLALGNGAPDVFASVAAVRGGHPRTGFGAILSAGTFVSAFVVGFVAIYAAPFSVDPASFVRDVLFYLISALFLFYVYLSAEIFLWQAVGFVGFYVFFVGFVFWMDLGMDGGRRKGGGELGNLVGDVEVRKGLVTVDCESGELLRKLEGGTLDFRFGQVLWKISKLWELPVSVLLKLTIPQASPSEWNRFYRSANIALCPLALLSSCNTFMPLNHPVIFLLPNTHFPLWLVVLFASSSLAVLHFVVEKEPPKTEEIRVVVIAFVMSVFWISTMAGELLNCLGALGALLKLPPALLGLTVLAWGNSVGDLVADVAVAKAGQPAMAMAGCFAGPMFNMLFGLGTALVIQTANVYPEAYELHFHVSIVVAFVFLFLSLMGSLLVVIWYRFRVPRFWGFCLVGLYISFIAVSLVIAKFAA
ncbi:Cation/calcium exchanger like [Actinidia chinensis var. chinensis]|uniref:Cation/calcium exchanger like n=1 Tax=Actinidia chinensis var. chinensis TaxID=1590841 RepID=A0A2R6QL67_ACTCC|nr:Cation/calcium exchanger like [Actinidia chinensis var. chinensis]